MGEGLKRARNAAKATRETPVAPHVAAMVAERDAADAKAKSADAGLATLSMPLACLLASVAVHAEEMISPHGHEFDRIALRDALNNPMVRAWLAEMTKAGFAPVKRNP